MKGNANHPIIAFYAKAIAEMKKNPSDMTNPTSWRYQGAIHDYLRPNATDAQRQARDPLFTTTDILPPPSEQLKFWRTCQHQSWFFLPWHRMYLHHFERIIMGHVARLGGPTDWALPYWNYSGSKTFGIPFPGSALLPGPFRTGGLPDLFVARREPLANQGQPFADATATDIKRCLQEPFPSSGSSGGFLGLKTVSNHAGGPAEGAVESSPHDLMHGAIGGSGGLMGNFIGAPLDPIFWLHHCNIDRLWEVWIARDTTHKNPVDPDWLTTSFDFHDAKGNPVSMKPSEVLDTKAAPLSYVYDDISDPV